jgi:hypothetical protein
LKNIKSYTLILISFLIASCSTDTNISTFTVPNGDFTNSMMVEGIAEAVLSTTLIAPNIYDGKIQYIVEDGEQVEEGQVVCIIENMELQSQYDQIMLQLENSEAGLSKTKADLNMQFALLEAQVLTNDADTKIAQMDSLQIEYMSLNQRAIKELELERASIEKARYEKKLDALKIIQQSEIKKLELEIQRFKIRVSSIKERLDALTLKAPKSGMAIRAMNPLTGNKLQVGDPVWANFALVTLPDFSQMAIKIKVSETNFRSININDSISYTFDAMPGNTGSGKITKKTPVGQPVTRGSAVKFFDIEASIDEVSTMPDPGFSANCNIIMKQIENVISIPQIALFDEDSIKVVYVRQNSGFESRQVLTDISSPTKIIISSGLKEGEVIALSKPKASLIKRRTALPDSLFQKPDIPAIVQKPN